MRVAPPPPPPPKKKWLLRRLLAGKSESASCGEVVDGDGEIDGEEEFSIMGKIGDATDISGSRKDFTLYDVGLLITKLRCTQGLQ